MRHYESGIRAVKPELLESIADTLSMSVNTLKDYGVENTSDLMSLLVRLENSFGIVLAADGTGLSLNPKAHRGGDLAVVREACAARERRDRRLRIRGLESLDVAALHISQSTQPNPDAKLGGERHSHLRKQSFYSPLHAKAFSAYLGSK